MTTKRDTRIIIRLAVPLRAELERIAERDHRSLADTARMILFESRES